MAKSRGDFTDILLKKQILSPDQLEEAHGVAQATGAKLNEALVKLDYATTEQVMSAIAEHSGMQYIDLTEVTIPPAVIELVPESVARENVVLPLSQEGTMLKIIMSDPTDVTTMEKLQFILNKQITPVLSPREQIVEAINRHYGQSETESVDSMLAEFTDTAIDFTDTEATSGVATDENDAPVIKLVNLIIQEAVSLRASDIHIEPFADRIRIRYRIDGVLVERDSPPRRLLAPMSSRIKIMGNIDIAEKRRPQDGRIKTATCTANITTCASASCRRATASRASCVSSIAVISRCPSRTSASPRTTTPGSSRSSNDPTASSWSPGRPGPARPPPCTPP